MSARTRLGRDGSSYLGPRTEATRERETYRYLHPWAATYHPPHLNGPSFSFDTQGSSHVPQGCEDTALAAFAQLGALRLQAQRCIISLLSTDIEYVLAESTKTISLQYDTTLHARDQLWLGTTNFARNDGLNGDVLKQWHRARELRSAPESFDYYYTNGSSPHWLILDDLRYHHELLDRPFYRYGSQSLRFYASVPIRTRLGSVIGSYTILDDKPRHGISAEEMDFMEDMADTIFMHLEATRATAQRQRSDRLIKGLGLFNTGESTLRHWYILQDSGGNLRGSRHDHKSTKDGDIARLDRANEEFGMQSKPEDFAPSASYSGHSRHSSLSSATNLPSSTTQTGAAATGAQEHPDVATHDFDRSPKKLSPDSSANDVIVTSENIDAERSRPLGEASSLKTFNLSNDIELTYARASNLIREALGAEGVIIFDANVPRTTTQTSPRDQDKGAGTASSAPSSSEADGSDASDFSGTENATNDVPGVETCDVLGFSTRIKSSVSGFLPSKNHLGLSKPFLERLIRKHPSGKIFNFENGAVSSSSGEEGSTASDTQALATEMVRKVRRTRVRGAKEAAALADLLSGVRSAAFLPLWDSSRERWSAGVLVWTTAPLRNFDREEDLTYMTAFGNSIMTELARLRAIAADRAKTTFISSVSHELRSPLHGVLAGVEFLRDSDLTVYQQEMVTSIYMAGTTLLDTVNHILDYAKITNLNDLQRKERLQTDLVRRQGDEEGDVREMGVFKDVELAKLLEDVTGTIVAGHKFQTMARSIDLIDARKSENTTPTKLSRSSLGSVQSDIQISFMLNIPWRSSWWASVSPGSWTRLLTNLVGNSLKYTKAGFISVSIDHGHVLSRTETYEKVAITLTVEDSGIGISQDYLRDNLYTPFSQEDSHATGTGLGLSIVKQIVSDLQGRIAVESTAGKGTKIFITFAVDFLIEPPSGHKDDLDDRRTEARDDFGSKQLHILTPDRHAGQAPWPNAEMFTRSISTMCSQWFELECSSGPTIDPTSVPRVVLATQSVIEGHEDASHGLLFGAGKGKLSDESSQPLLVILGSSIYNNTSDYPRNYAGLHTVVVDQPLGPRKMARILETASQNQSQTPRCEPQAEFEGSAETSFFRIPTWANGHRPDMPPLDAATDSSSSDEEPTMHHESPRVEPRPRPPSLVRSTPAVPSLALSMPRSRPVLPRSMTGAVPKSNSLDRAVLLVEDNEINMRLLVALMRKADSSHESAENGLIAFEKYAAAPAKFFLILMDLSMPVMDGFAATAKIREYEKKNKLTPCTIVALTGVASNEARRNALASGVDDFLTKPISMKIISALVQTLKTTGRWVQL